MERKTIIERVPDSEDRFIAYAMTDARPGADAVELDEAEVRAHLAATGLTTDQIATKIEEAEPSKQSDAVKRQR